MGLIDALNRAYDIEEGRPWWKVRLLAIGLTLALAALILVAFALVLVGPTAAEYIARVTGLGPVFAWTWKILQWPVVLALVAAGAGFLYYFAPDAEQEWVWVTPGAGLAAVHLAGRVTRVLLRGALCHLHRDLRRDRRRDGPAPLVLPLRRVMLAGAELNAEIEHASPYGKAAGEKVPGAKRVIGALAYQRYLTRPPSPPARRPPASPPRGRRSPIQGRCGVLSRRSSPRSSSSGAMAVERRCGGWTQRGRAVSGSSCRTVISAIQGARKDPPRSEAMDNGRSKLALTRAPRDST